VFGQRLEGLFYVCVDEAVEYFFFCTDTCSGRLADAFVQVQILEFAKLDLGRPTLRFAISVDAGVGEDPVEPSLRLVPALKVL